MLDIRDRSAWNGKTAGWIAPTAPPRRPHSSGKSISSHPRSRSMRSSTDERPLRVCCEMTIHLKMFAILRERSGAAEAELNLPEGADVSAAVAEAGRQFPNMAELLPRAAVAVNLDYAQRQVVLHDGDE